MYMFTCAQVLDVRERVLGPDHPEVAACANNLAVLLRSLGRHGEAEALYARSIAIKERAMGPTHPQARTPHTIILMDHGAARTLQPSVCGRAVTTHGTPFPAWVMESQRMGTAACKRVHRICWSLEDSPANSTDKCCARRWRCRWQTWRR